MRKELLSWGGSAKRLALPVSIREGLQQKDGERRQGRGPSLPPYTLPSHGPPVKLFKPAGESASLRDKTPQARRLACGLAPLEPLPLVYRVIQWLTGTEPTDVFQQHREMPLGDVRRQNHSFHLPERMFRRQRLDLVHIEGRTGDFFGLERLHQVREIDNGTAADVD